MATIGVAAARHMLTRVTSGPDWDEREILARFDDLELLLRSIAGENASISSSRDPDSNGIVADLTMEPRVGDGCPAYVVAFGELVVGVGQTNCRIELEYSDQNFRLVKRILGAVVDGRVTETFGIHRSRVVITFEDGKTMSFTDLDGCLSLLVPQPGWHRWGRRLHYAPYV
ncbi:MULTISPECIES: hypothetical protein [unclassified Agromyces]|uniref:hypothetical protein n=1 Tax=unclassified Agromyces TaxID=2639701 RepID=UPI0030149A85